jgi:anti-sigma factor RsiW
MNHNCEQFGELISGLIDNELTPEETRKVNSHLNQCADCRNTQAEFESLDRAIQSPNFPEKVALPCELDRPTSQKPAKATRKSGLNSSRLWMPLAATSAALVAVGVSIFWPTANAGAKTTEVHVPSLELDQLENLNRQSKKNTDSTLKTMELQLRLMRINAKGLNSDDPDQAAVQAKIEQMLQTLKRLSD